MPGFLALIYEAAESQLAVVQWEMRVGDFQEPKSAWQYWLILVVRETDRKTVVAVSFFATF